MRSIPAKKICAAVAGTALLAASLAAAAPVYFDNIEIINRQGMPVVQVVVGAKAHPSDGVAAANIAAVIGNLAHYKKTYKAIVTGAPNCTVVGEAAGTCVSDITAKKVILEVPGVPIPPGAFSFKTYLYGFIDVGKEDDQAYNTIDALAITEDDFPVFKETRETISPMGTLRTMQKAYVHQTSSPPVFDVEKAKYRIRLKEISYKTEYDDVADVYNGVPMCADEDVFKTSNATITKACPSGKSLKEYRPKISFLGEKWILDTILLYNSSNASQGIREIKLVKEAVAERTYYIGDNQTVGEFTLKLADLTMPYGYTPAKAVLEFYDATGKKVKDAIQCPPDPKLVNVSYGECTGASGYETYEMPDKTKITVYVAATTPAFGLGKWARMSIVAKEMTLVNGSTVDTEKNKNWSVILGFSAYAGAGNPTYGALSAITLKRDAFDEPMYEGDSYNIIESPVVFKLVAMGRTLTDADRTPLRITRESKIYYNETGSAILDPINFVCYSSPDLKKIKHTALADPQSKICISRDNLSANDYHVGVYEKEGKLYNFTTTNTTFDLTYSDLDDIRISYNVSSNFTTITESAAKSPFPDQYPVKYSFKTVGEKFQSEEGSDTKISIYETLNATATSTERKERGVGYISHKGSKIAARTEDRIDLALAKKTDELIYTLQTVEMVAAPGEVTMKEGETQTISGVPIKVKKIDVSLAPCSVAPGVVTCTPAMGTIKAEIEGLGKATVDAAVIYPVDTAKEEMVVLDAERPTADKLILVGGPLVNTLTEETIRGTEIKFTPGMEPLVKVLEKKIIVAGWTAADTRAAAREFIAKLIAQRT